MGESFREKEVGRDWSEFLVRNEDWRGFIESIWSLLWIKVVLGWFGLRFNTLWENLPDKSNAISISLV